MPWISVCALWAATTFAAPAQVLEVRTSKATAPAASKVACIPNAAGLVRQAAFGALPPGYRLRGIFLNGVCVPKAAGVVTAQLQWPEPLSGGRHEIMVYFVAGGRTLGQAMAQVDLEPTMAAQQVAVMGRGAEVKIIVRSGNVTVQATALAQQAAGLGEMVSVMPNGGTRVIRGRVLDAQTVEVTL